jgi:hypothetical protein
MPRPLPSTHAMSTGFLLICLIFVTSSFAIVFSELLTGLRPFFDVVREDHMMFKVYQKERPKLPPTLPPQAVAFIGFAFSVVLLSDCEVRAGTQESSTDHLSTWWLESSENCVRTLFVSTKNCFLRLIYSFFSCLFLPEIEPARRRITGGSSSSCSLSLLLNRNSQRH